MIYLDHAAATPVDPRVLKAMLPYFSDNFFNPAAAYTPAREVKADFEEARHRLAMAIGARPAEIVLTAGATESDNIALHGVTGEVVTTAIEHPAVLALARARGGNILSVDSEGQINLAELKAAITDQTELVSVCYVNSETGTVADLKAISEVLAECRAERRSRNIKRQLLLHTDASQAVGVCDLNVARLGVDLMTLNAGKCYGPKQTGLLYVRGGVILRPLIYGGGQEMGLRAGTENVANAVGFAVALELAERLRKSETKRLSVMRRKLVAYLQSELPDAQINGSKAHQSPAILNFSVPGLDGERAVFALDERGVMVSTGSACAANRGTRSHVLLALGLSPELVDGSIRLSLGRLVDDAKLTELEQILAPVIKEQLQFGSAVCI